MAFRLIDRGEKLSIPEISGSSRKAFSAVKLSIE